MLCRRDAVNVRTLSASHRSDSSSRPDDFTPLSNHKIVPAIIGQVVRSSKQRRKFLKIAFVSLVGVLRSEAVKKWDWLRADVGVLQGFRVAARCLFQFFHSLSAKVAELARVRGQKPEVLRLLLRCQCPSIEDRRRNSSVENSQLKRLQRFTTLRPLAINPIPSRK